MTKKPDRQSFDESQVAELIKRSIIHNHVKSERKSYLPRLSEVGVKRLVWRLCDCEEFITRIVDGIQTVARIYLIWVEIKQEVHIENSPTSRVKADYWGGKCVWIIRGMDTFKNSPSSRLGFNANNNPLSWVNPDRHIGDHFNLIQ